MLALAATLSLSLLVSGRFSSSRDLRALVDLLEETHGNGRNVHGNGRNVHGNGRNVHNEGPARNNDGFTVRELHVQWMQQDMFSEIHADATPYTQEAVGHCPDGLWIESEYQCEAAATALGLQDTDAPEHDCHATESALVHLATDDFSNLNWRRTTFPLPECGVCSQDGASGTGFIMYHNDGLDAPAFLTPNYRFPDAHPNNYNRFLGVRFSSGNWHYDTNSAWREFTPAPEDVLVASVDYSADTCSVLSGGGSHEGIAKLEESDLECSANARYANAGTGSNGGEFYIKGTYFAVQDRVSLCHMPTTLPECTVGVECRDWEPHPGFCSHLYYTCQATDLPSVGWLLDGPTNQPWCPTGFVHWDRDLSNSSSDTKFDNVDSIEDCAELCRLRSVFGYRFWIDSRVAINTGQQSIFGPGEYDIHTWIHTELMSMDLGTSVINLARTGRKTAPCVAFEYERVGSSKRCKLKTRYSKDTETIGQQNVNWRSCILLQAGQANSNLIVPGDSLVVQAPLSSSSSSGCYGPGSDNEGCP